MEGIFVVGTDTGVGKTTVCAGLMKMLHGFAPSQYWKPVQTGTVLGDDTKEVQALTELGPDSFMEPVYRFAQPLAPELAAKKFHKTIVLHDIVAAFEKRKRGNILIVEGAGGILVPYSANVLQLDLVKALGLPVLVIAEDRLGAINHTLLTLRECKNAGVETLGVVLTRSSEDFGNKESIEHFGGVPVLAQVPAWEDQKGLVGKVGRDTELRALFGLPPVAA